MGSDQSKFCSILRREVRRTVQKLERFCPSPDQPVEACQLLHGEAKVVSKTRSVHSSPVKASIGFWPSLLRSTSCFSPRTLFSAGGWTIWVTVLTLSPKSGLGTGLGLVCICYCRPDVGLFPLLEARSWQEAKSNLVTVALGRGVKFVTLTGLSLARHVALPDHGVGLDGQSCSCLIVGWPVGSFISNPGCWTVDRSCSCLIVGRLIDHMSRTVRGCYRGGIRARSVEVLLDTPPGCPKNCPAAKGDSVQISLSRRVSFFMMKPRLCPSQDQSSPVQSSRPWGFGQVLSDQPAASRLEHCELVPIIFKDSFSAGGWSIWVTLLVLRVLGHIGRTTGAMVLTLSPKSGLGTGLGLVFPLLEARSWQEAKSNLVTVALGKDDRIAWCWTLGLPLTRFGIRPGPVSNYINVRVAKPYALTQRDELVDELFVTLTGSSLTRHVALPDHGVGLDSQSCSCLIVGWPVGSFISNPGCWTVDREETEEDSWSGVGCASTEPTNTSYPITTHTPNTDETRPRPCKRENLKLGAKRSTGKFAGKVPGKFTGDNPAIDLNPALDSVGPNSPTLRTRTVRYTRTSVCVRQHTQESWPSVSTPGRPWPSSAHTGRPAVHQYTYQHAPWTVRVILAHVGCLFCTNRTSVSTGRTSVAVRVCVCPSVSVSTHRTSVSTADVRGCPVCPLCPSAHTGRPSAHAGRPSAHAGRPWLSVCPSAHAGRPSVHTGRPSAHKGRPSAHAGRPWLSVCVRVSSGGPSVSIPRTSVASVSTHRSPSVHRDVRGVPSATQWAVRQHTQDVRVCPLCPSYTTRTSVSTHRTSVVHTTSVSNPGVCGRRHVHISACWPFPVDCSVDLGPVECLISVTHRTSRQHTSGRPWPVSMHTQTAWD
ncbi:hypothetical protein IGI04_019230 [Brassica rapa subsp. trilocularis]|uniref:Uncharacterized protein n=1 Tax=Brassica rapa subsp. trilocularis TaxID=1813537 RepID=A0ABQ7MIN9_BRACM|nr:hypothetical protein IGI04_019230 [Brassica rapa subsp. trilocularis]